MIKKLNKLKPNKGYPKVICNKFEALMFNYWDQAEALDNSKLMS